MRVSSATEHEHLVHDARSVNLEGFAARYLNDSQAVECFLKSSRCSNAACTDVRNMV